MNSEDRTKTVPSGWKKLRVTWQAPHLAKRTDEIQIAADGGDRDIRMVLAGKTRFWTPESIELLNVEVLTAEPRGARRHGEE